MCIHNFLGIQGQKRTCKISSSFLQNSGQVIILLKSWMQQNYPVVVSSEMQISYLGKQPLFGIFRWQLNLRFCILSGLLDGVPTF